VKVRDVMTEGAECTRPDATIREAAARMKELDVGVLPVCEGDRLVGMLTDRDIILRSVAAGHAPEEHSVKEAMTKEMFYCFEEEDIAEVTKIMRQRQIRRVPVLNHDKRLTGIVSIGDVAVTTHDDRMVGRAIEDISEPSMPRRWE
jgi:CBS domain-containing protein